MPGAQADAQAELLPSVRRVARYAGMRFDEALALPCDMFLLMNKNALIEELSATDEGRRYLDDCRRLAGTEMDFAGLRALKEGIEHGGD